MREGLVQESIFKVETLSCTGRWVWTLPYNEPEEVRELCGLPDEVTDEVLGRFIEKGDRAAIGKLIVTIFGEEPEGSVNGDNKSFTLGHSPLADINADSKVDAYDLTVWKWYTPNDVISKVKMEVGEIDAVYKDGLITLISAPEIGQALTVDYAYYPQEVDFDKLKHAAAYFSGYFYILSEWLLLPDNYALGPLRFKSSYPWLLLEKEAMKLIHEIRSKLHIKGEASPQTGPVRVPVTSDTEVLRRGSEEIVLE